MHHVNTMVACKYKVYVTLNDLIMQYGTTIYIIWCCSPDFIQYLLSLSLSQGEAWMEMEVSDELLKLLLPAVASVYWTILEER